MRREIFEKYLDNGEFLPVPVPDLSGQPITREGDTLTILAGEDMDEERFDALCGRIEEAQPDLEIDAHRGGQPLYPVIFSIE